MQVEAGFPLSRLTTIGTGGPAAALARPSSLTELEDAIRWASERGLAVVTAGFRWKDSKTANTLYIDEIVADTARIGCD